MTVYRAVVLQGQGLGYTAGFFPPGEGISPGKSCLRFFT